MILTHTQMGSPKGTNQDSKESGNQVLKVRCNQEVTFGLEKKRRLKERHDVFLQIFIGLSYRTIANGWMSQGDKYRVNRRNYFGLFLYTWELPLTLARTFLTSLSSLKCQSPCRSANACGWISSNDIWGEPGEAGASLEGTFMKNTHFPELEQTPGPQESRSTNHRTWAELNPRKLKYLLTGGQREESFVLNQEAAIFLRLVENGGPSLIMVNLSKPNGHSSHPVGNKHPQVKFYKVLKGTLWVLREP